jgi:hypothetical protein
MSGRPHNAHLNREQIKPENTVAIGTSAENLRMQVSPRRRDEHDSVSVEFGPSYGPGRRAGTTMSLDEIAPATLQNFESAAIHQQRTARRLQATYLLILLAAPVSRLVPIPGGRRAGVHDTASALLLLAAVGMRLLIRLLAADSDWVKARRQSEQLRAGAWRRCMTGRAEPDDGRVGREISTTDVPTRWQFYLQHRVDDQISYFTDRAELHRRTARRWRWIRLILTIGTFIIATVSLVISVPSAMIGLVSALLASSEAWLQFRRSEILRDSYAEAGAELRQLRALEPTDETSLGLAVDAVELALERERWTWTAIMSVAVLASAGPRPSMPGKAVPG